MTTFARGLFCVLFGVVLLIPMGLTLTGTALTEALDENRNRAPFPDGSDCRVLELDQCHKKIDRWFNDHYQPRDLLIKLQTQINYSVFSTSDKVHIGPDNWLFYRSTMDVEKVAAERISDARFEELLGEFEALDRYLDERGIELIVLPIPLKDVIYPEHVPRSAPVLPSDSRYQELRQWLAEHDSIPTIDAFEHFMEGKSRSRVFHKTDFHWNDPTGFEFAEKLVNQLWQIQSPGESALWAHELDVAERPFNGGQARFLPLLAAPSEQGLFVDYTWQRARGRHDYNPSDGVWDYIYDGREEPRGRLDGMVVFGDSYFDAMHRSGIDTYFSAVHRARLRPERLPQIYEAIPEGTRYFVFEFIEVALPRLAASGLSVPAGDSPSPE